MGVREIVPARRRLSQESTAAALRIGSGFAREEQVFVTICSGASETVRRSCDLQDSNPRVDTIRYMRFGLHIEGVGSGGSR